MRARKREAARRLELLPFLPGRLRGRFSRGRSASRGVYFPHSLQNGPSPQCGRERPETPLNRPRSPKRRTGAEPL